MSSQKEPKHRVILILILVILWLLSVAIAFFLFIPILESFTRIYAAFWGDADPVGQAFFLGVSLRNGALFVLAILYVIGIIGGAEHHSRNFNTPSSWHVLLLTYAILLTTFLFTLFF